MFAITNKLRAVGVVGVVGVALAASSLAAPLASAHQAARLGSTHQAARFGSDQAASHSHRALGICVDSPFGMYCSTISNPTPHTFWSVVSDGVKSGAGAARVVHVPGWNSIQLKRG